MVQVILLVRLNSLQETQLTKFIPSAIVPLEKQKFVMPVMVLGRPK
jgi:hypothetical protein